MVRTRGPEGFMPDNLPRTNADRLCEASSPEVHLPIDGLPGNYVFREPGQAGPMLLALLKKGVPSAVPLRPPVWEGHKVQGRAAGGDTEDIDQLLRCCATAHLDGVRGAEGYQPEFEDPRRSPHHTLAELSAPWSGLNPWYPVASLGFSRADPDRFRLEPPMRSQGIQSAQDILAQVFEPWCKIRGAQLFRFAHKHFTSGDGRGAVVFSFPRTCDVENRIWPVEELGWRYVSQQFIVALGVKTNHVLSAVQRYNPAQQCVVVVLVREVKFDRFYFLNAPRVSSCPYTAEWSAADRPLQETLLSGSA